MHIKTATAVQHASAGLSSNSTAATITAHVRRRPSSGPRWTPIAAVDPWYSSARLSPGRKWDSVNSIWFARYVLCICLTIQDVHGHCIKIVWSYRAGIVSRVLFANLGYRQRGVGTVVHQICTHAVRNNFIRNALAINRITFSIFGNDVIICLRFVCSFIRHKTSGSVKSNE